MRWKTKALIQRILSRMPGGSYVYWLGQKHIFGLKDFNIEPKLRNGLKILKGLSNLGVTVEGKNIVEIGTGWTPIIPIFFWLLGAKKCTSFDISRLVKSSIISDSVNQLIHLLSNNDDFFDSKLIRALDYKRLTSLKEVNRESMEDLFKLCNLIYYAPYDGSSTDLPRNSIDIAFSNEVLEHIPEHEILQLMPEIQRILRVGGIMAHYIDLGDHFSFSDLSISQINFLKFSDKSFSIYNTKFNYQNRFRIPEYKQLIKKTGFSIVDEYMKINKESLEILPTIHVDYRFSEFTPDELCTTTYCVVARSK